MDDPTTEARPLRFCDECGGLDDHPRHTISGVVGGIGKPDPAKLAEFTLDGAPPAALAQLFDPTVRVRHHDCCAAAGCPLCTETEKLNEGRRGAALIDHLEATRGAVEFEAPDLPAEMMGRTTEGAING